MARGKDFCDMYSSSKSCYNMMIFEVIKLLLLKCISKTYRLLHDGYLPFLNLQANFALMWYTQSICLCTDNSISVYRQYIYILVLSTEPLLWQVNPELQWFQMREQETQAWLFQICWKFVPWTQKGNWLLCHWKSHQNHYRHQKPSLIFYMW